MNIKHTLEKLGFSTQDAAIYIALLKAGESAVGAIISETGFHRDLVYGGLKRLEQQDLAQSIEKKKIRHYQASNPNLLLRKMQEKADLAAALLPDLQSMFTQPAVSVKVFEGADGLEEIEKDWAASLEDKAQLLCIGGAGKAWYEVAKTFYRPYHEKLFARGIRIKTVTYPDEAKGIMESEIKGLNQLRVIGKQFHAPASTVIYADKILIQVFGERYIGIVIQSKSISDAYRQYFKLLWSSGKPG